jgi:hypothetical protein
MRGFVDVGRADGEAKAEASQQLAAAGGGGGEDQGRPFQEWFQG